MCTALGNSAIRNNNNLLCISDRFQPMSNNNNRFILCQLLNGLLEFCLVFRVHTACCFMLVGGVSPYVWFATHFIDAILIGPVFMLMVAKVRKNGPFLLTSLITGVVLVAATWMFPITGLVGGILCELCLRAGQFRRKSWLMLGFFCFNLGFIGDFLPLWFTKESYLEYAAQMMDAGYMATMEGLLTWPVFGVIVLSILVGSVLGSLLGMKLMRKHFVKAGLAQ